MVRERLRPYRRTVALLVVLQLVQTFATLWLPTLNADIIDNGVARGDTAYILAVGGFMLAVTLLQVLCAGAAVWCGVRLAAQVGRDLRAALFEGVQRFSRREMNRFGTATLITRVTNDVQQVQQILAATLNLVVPAPIMGVGGLVMALGQDVPMSLLVLTSLPLLMVPVGLVLRRLVPWMADAQGRVDTVNRIVREQITGVRVIRAFGREDHEQKRFTEASAGLRDLSVRIGRGTAVLLPLCMLVPNLANLAVVWFGGHRVAGGDMHLGDLVAFLHYLELLLLAAVMATFMLMLLPRARVCAERVQEVLDTEPGLAPPATPVTPVNRRGLVEVRDVDFGYPGADELVLRGVDFTARPGGTTAVVGSTGSGKSTLLGLLSRQLDPDRGTVSIDGVDLRDLSPAALAATVAVVPQRSYLFSGTVADNLRYGNPRASDAELWRALEIAQARDFVADLPGGLDAPVGQGGGNFSGGQRQRLSIARALVARPLVYVLDDAFSALDHATETALRAALAEATGDATVVLVAQRVATVRDADRIVVMDQGRVAAAGSHSQLLASDRTYREIVSSQLTGEETP
ncbi:ABC transporter ATP-binding protein [Streptomyces sp. NPDC006235]|uniref:ABC transporter ATP-binding protein n=1 Tax=Streptomyces sp. NPDC006235 TaxID=3156736 RepID=UPI0033A187E8